MRLNCYGVVEGDSMCQSKGSFEECPDIWGSYMAMQSCSSPMIACYKRGVRGKTWFGKLQPGITSGFGFKLDIIGSTGFYLKMFVTLLYIS